MCLKGVESESSRVESSRLKVALRRAACTFFAVLLEEKAVDAARCILHICMFYVSVHSAFAPLPRPLPSPPVSFSFSLFYLSEPLRSFPSLSLFTFVSSPSPLAPRPAPRRCLHFLTFLKPVSHLVVTESLNSKNKRKKAEREREREGRRRRRRKKKKKKKKKKRANPVRKNRGEGYFVDRGVFFFFPFSLFSLSLPPSLPPFSLARDATRDSFR